MGTKEHGKKTWLITRAILNVVLLFVLGLAAVLLIEQQPQQGNAVIGALQGVFSDTSSSYQNAQPTETVTIAEYTTTSSVENPDRDNNIRLACESLDGTMVGPGETFSLEQALGDTTDKTRYRSAPVIVDGSNFENEVGGGVCQVASTLYYVALKANMSVVERYAHTIPPEYIPLGFDATLDYGSMDLKLRNDSSSPIYIEAVYKDTSVNIKCYGTSLGQDEHVELTGETQRVISPGGPEYTLTDKLASGEEQVQTPARDGYDVSTTRSHYKGNVKTSEEQISFSTYEPVNAVILRGVETNQK